MVAEPPIPLSPCPFCGGDAVAYWNPRTRYEGDGWGDHMGSAWPVHADRGERMCSRAMRGYEFSASTREEAIRQVAKAWNTRAHTTPESVPQDVMERVARAIYKNNPATTNGTPMDWEYCALTFPERIYECMEDAEAAIAALGNGSATIAPVPAEIVQPITPASEAYQKVKEALQLARCRSMNGKVVYDDAIAALPSLMPVAPSETRYNMVELRSRLSEIVTTYDPQEPFLLDGNLRVMNEVMAALDPYLRHSPPVDIEAGAIALSQWVYGTNHGVPRWDRLSEEHRNEYREQAKACARAWGLREREGKPGVLTDDDKREIVNLMVGRAEAMGDISMMRNMGNALSALLSDPRFELRRRG